MIADEIATKVPTAMPTPAKFGDLLPHINAQIDGRGLNRSHWPERRIAQMSDAKFEKRENGPLVARGITSMTGADGQSIEVKPVMALCRCGHSANKPFCDGSHKTAGFESRGGAPAGRDRLIAYEGDDVTVFFNPLLCSHAAECNRLRPHVFDTARRPWIDPNAGSVEDVETVVRACPSGALTMDETTGAPQHRIADRADIVIQNNGPYWITGIAPPTDLAGENASPDKYVLCRCGLSGNKPYCDGSHRDKGWKEEAG